MARFFRFPWATTGDRVEPPFPTDPGGTASYSQGFGPNYELPNTDPNYEPVPRDLTNGLYYDLTDNLRQYQLAGVPDWHPAADNDGVAISYPINAEVRWNDLVYRSVVANNTVEPGTDTSWRLIEAWTGATTAAFGVVRYATNTEARAKSATDRALTPSNLPSIQTGLLNATYITASGDFTVPAGVTRLYVKVIGGGGGGGGANTSLRHGGGGGGGGVAEGFITVTPGDVISAVVGPGGAAGLISNSAPGGNGGSSSFGGLSATGGLGGAGAASSGAGGQSGIGSGGSLNYGLGDGGDGNNSEAVRGAGVGGGNGGNQGRAGRSPGSGGGGAYDSGGAGSTNAGAGAAGVVVVMY